MHVPDGFIDAPTSVATGAVAAAAVAVSLRGARRELDERTAPLAGMPRSVLLGLFPTVETIAAQAVTIALLVAGFLVVNRRPAAT